MPKVRKTTTRTTKSKAKATSRTKAPASINTEPVAVSEKIEPSGGGEVSTTETVDMTKDISSSIVASLPKHLQDKLKNPPPVSQTGISVTSDVAIPKSNASEMEIIEFLLKSIKKYHLQNPLRVTGELSKIRGKIAELNTQYKV
jgi:hypothetical protein